MSADDVIVTEADVAGFDHSGWPPEKVEMVRAFFRSTIGYRVVDVLTALDEDLQRRRAS
jgi:hypothetical protein